MFLLFLSFARALDDLFENDGEYVDVHEYDYVDANVYEEAPYVDVYNYDMQYDADAFAGSDGD